MQQVDLPSHSLVQQYKRWGHLISHRISEMTHIVLFSTVAINKHERRDGARGGGTHLILTLTAFYVEIIYVHNLFWSMLEKRKSSHVLLTHVTGW